MEDAVESARAANMSEDTKPAVEEMEAMDEEPPTELQQLLQHLEGRGEFGSEAVLQVSLEGEGNYCDITWKSYCREDRSFDFLGKFRMPWGSEAKHRLLRAIGNCRTLYSIQLIGLPGNDVETTLTPMQSNSVLEEIYVSVPYMLDDSCDDAGFLDRICLALGRILQNSCSFKYLGLCGCSLSGTGAYHLASGLQGNSESSLERLTLDRLEESRAAKHIAEIVQATPTLRNLALGVGIVDDEGIDALANALAQSTSLKA